MLNPHFVAGEHGLFGGHKSEDIRTFFCFDFCWTSTYFKVYRLSRQTYTDLQKSKYFDLVSFHEDIYPSPKKSHYVIYNVCMYFVYGESAELDFPEVVA